MTASVPAKLSWTFAASAVRPNTSWRTTASAPRARTCSVRPAATRSGCTGRPPAARTPVRGAGRQPPPADWLLETASGDGQVHRFRDLTALQKWIIERKVTREDRISKTGQAWRRLGEIVELQPFFDVVDEADRAKAAAAAVGARGLSAQAADARRNGRTPGARAVGGRAECAGRDRGGRLPLGRAVPRDRRRSCRSRPRRRRRASTRPWCASAAVAGRWSSGWRSPVWWPTWASGSSEGGLDITPSQLAALGRRSEPPQPRPPVAEPPPAPSPGVASAPPAVPETPPAPAPAASPPGAAVAPAGQRAAPPPPARPESAPPPPAPPPSAARRPGRGACGRDAGQRPREAGGGARHDRTGAAGPRPRRRGRCGRC